MNEGKIIREVNRRCDAARDIANLVAVLTEDPDEIGTAEPEQESSGGWLSSLFSRK